MNLHFNQLFETTVGGFIAKTDIRLGAVKIQKGAFLAHDYPNFNMFQLVDRTMEVSYEDTTTTILKVLPDV